MRDKRKLQQGKRDKPVTQKLCLAEIEVTGVYQNTIVQYNRSHIFMVIEMTINKLGLGILQL